MVLFQTVICQSKRNDARVNATQIARRTIQSNNYREKWEKQTQKRQEQRENLTKTNKNRQSK